MKAYRIFLTAGAGLLLAFQVLAQPDTNAVSSLARDDGSGNYLQLQEQIHAAQLAIMQSQVSCC